MDEIHLHRRKEDTLKYKLGFIAAVITSLGIIGGGFFWLGSTKWVEKEPYTLKCAEIDVKINTTERDIAVVKTNLDNVGVTVKEIKSVQEKQGDKLDKILFEVRK